MMILYCGIRSFKGEKQSMIYIIIGIIIIFSIIILFYILDRILDCGLLDDNSPHTRDFSRELGE